MITEMERGFMGHCPTTGVSDIYAQAFDLWHAGKKREGFDMFGRVLAFTSIPNADSWALIARGVFKEDTIIRSNNGRAAAKPDESGKREIREALNTYLKPWLKG